MSVEAIRHKWHCIKHQREVYTIAAWSDCIGYTVPTVAFEVLYVCVCVCVCVWCTYVCVWCTYVCVWCTYVCVWCVVYICVCACGVVYALELQRYIDIEIHRDIRPSDNNCQLTRKSIYHVNVREGMC